MQRLLRLVLPSLVSMCLMGPPHDASAFDLLKDLFGGGGASVYQSYEADKAHYQGGEGGHAVHVGKGGKKGGKGGAKANPFDWLFGSKKCGKGAGKGKGADLGPAQHADYLQKVSVDAAGKGFYHGQAEGLGPQHLGPAQGASPKVNAHGPAQTYGPAQSGLGDAKSYFDPPQDPHHIRSYGPAQTGVQSMKLHVGGPAQHGGKSYGPAQHGGKSYGPAQHGGKSYGPAQHGEVAPGLSPWRGDATLPAEQAVPAPSAPQGLEGLENSGLADPSA